MIEINQLYLVPSLAEDNTLTKVLQRVGMVKIKTLADEENGAVWLWQIANNPANSNL